VHPLLAAFADERDAPFGVGETTSSRAGRGACGFGDGVTTPDVRSDTSGMCWLSTGISLVGLDGTLAGAVMSVGAADERSFVFVIVVVLVFVLVILFIDGS